MITVAIAGGTSAGLGRSIVSALTQHPNEFKVVVLGRATSKAPEWLQKTEIELRRVEYSSEESLFAAVEGVHTVICVLLATDGTWASSQINLLKASLRAGVRRFAPSEWGVGPLAAKHVDILRPQIAVIDACREAKQKDPNFEYAGFHLGLFMNYLGYGAKDEKRAMNGLNDSWVCIWDVEKMKADIPLTKEGSVPQMSMMEIGDVGRFVAAACRLPAGSWKEDFSMVGETISLDEVTKVIEKVRGRNMKIKQRPYKQVVEEEEKEKTFYPNRMWAQLEVMQARNRVGEGIVEPILNKLCPDVKPMTVEEYVRTFWS